MKQIFFITGTDTGVGKTVLTALLARFLRERGVRVAALKPVCSGGRDDARVLRAALDGALTLDEINPWHFRAADCAALAAALEKKSVTLAQVLAHIRAMREKLRRDAGGRRGRPVESARREFDSRDLIIGLARHSNHRRAKQAGRGEPRFADARSVAKKSARARQKSF